MAQVCRWCVPRRQGGAGLRRLANPPRHSDADANAPWQLAAHREHLHPRRPCNVNAIPFRACRKHDR
eukprot:6578936-Pyramimonas_sp.AAC.1